MQALNSYQVPINTRPGSIETIVDKIPCLRAYTLIGIRTHDPLITSREHKPLHHSAPKEDVSYTVVSLDIRTIILHNDIMF